MKKDHLVEIKRIKELMSHGNVNFQDVTLVTEGRGNVLWNLIEAGFGWKNVDDFVEKMLKASDDDVAKISTHLGTTNDDALEKSIKTAVANKNQLKKTIDNISAKLKTDQILSPMENEIATLLERLVKKTDLAGTNLTAAEIRQIKKNVIEAAIEKNQEPMFLVALNALKKLSKITEKDLDDYLKKITDAFKEKTGRDIDPDILSTIRKKLIENPDIKKLFDEIPSPRPDDDLIPQDIFPKDGYVEQSNLYKLLSADVPIIGPILRILYTILDITQFDEFCRYFINLATTIRGKAASVDELQTQLKGIINEMQRVSDRPINDFSKNNRLRFLDAQLKDVSEKLGIAQRAVNLGDADRVFNQFIDDLNVKLARASSDEAKYPGGKFLYEWFQGNVLSLKGILKKVGIEVDAPTKLDDLDAFFKLLGSSKAQYSAGATSWQSLKTLLYDVIPGLKEIMSVTSGIVNVSASAGVWGKQLGEAVSSAKNIVQLFKSVGTFFSSIVKKTTNLFLNNFLYGVYTDFDVIKSILARNGYVKGSFVLYFRFMIFHEVIIPALEAIKNEIAVWFNQTFPSVGLRTVAIVANPFDSIMAWTESYFGENPSEFNFEVEKNIAEIQQQRENVTEAILDQIKTSLNNIEWVPIGETFIKLFSYTTGIGWGKVINEDFNTMVGGKFGDVIISIMEGLRKRNQGGDLFDTTSDLEKEAQNIKDRLDKMTEKDIVELTGSETIKKSIDDAIIAKEIQLDAWGLQQGQFSQSTFTEIKKLLALNPKYNSIKELLTGNNQEEIEKKKKELEDDAKLASKDATSSSVVGMLIGSDFYEIMMAPYFTEYFAGDVTIKPENVITNIKPTPPVGYKFTYFFKDPKSNKLYGIDQFDEFISGKAKNDIMVAAKLKLTNQLNTLVDDVEGYGKIMNTSEYQVNFWETKLKTPPYDNKLKYRNLWKAAGSKEPLAGEIGKYFKLGNESKQNMIKYLQEINKTIDKAKVDGVTGIDSMIKKIYARLQIYKIKVDQDNHLILQENRNILKSKLLKIINEMNEGKKFGEDNFKHWKDTFKFKKYDEKTNQLKDVKITTKMDEIMDRIDHFRKKYDEDDSFVRAVIDVYGTGIDIIQYTKGLAHLTEGVIVGGLLGVLSTIRESKELVTWTVKHYKDGNWELVKGNFNKKELLNVGKTKRERDERQKESDNPAEGLKKKEQESIMILSRDEKEGLNGLPTKVKQKVKEKLRQGWTTEKPFDFLNTYYTESEINSVFNDKIKIYKLKPSAEFFRSLAKNSSKVTVKKGFCKSVKNAKGEYDLSEREKNTLNHFISKCGSKFGI